MPKFKSHPVEVEAWQFIIPSNTKNEFIMEYGARVRQTAPLGRVMVWELWVEKSGSWCVINDGDYIIREPDGTGHYPCAREIFEGRYYQPGATFDSTQGEVKITLPSEPLPGTVIDVKRMEGS
jgi:hypothetical protein